MLEPLLPVFVGGGVIAIVAPASEETGVGVGITVGVGVGVGAGGGAAARTVTLAVTSPQSCSVWSGLTTSSSPP